MHTLKKPGTQNDIPVKVSRKNASLTEQVLRKLFNETLRTKFPDKSK